jgi:hypothetical protein
MYIYVIYLMFFILNTVIKKRYFVDKYCKLLIIKDINR